MTRKKLLFFQVSLYWSVCSTSISLGNSFVTYLFTLFLPCTVLIKLHPHFILILGEMCLTFFSSFEDSATYSFHQWWIKWSIWWCRKVIRPLHGLRVKTLYEANLSLLEKKLQSGNPERCGVIVVKVCIFIFCFVLLCWCF